MHVHLFHFEKRQARFKVITNTYGIYTHNVYNQANEGPWMQTKLSVYILTIKCFLC